jgi:hypothetical protein
VGGGVHFGLLRLSAYDSGVHPVAEEAAFVVTLNADAVVLVTAEDINETVFSFDEEADVSAAGPGENGDAADNRSVDFFGPTSANHAPRRNCCLPC